MNYRSPHSKPGLSNFLLYGGNIIMLKHSESGGFVTVDERSTVRQEGMLEAYVKVCKLDHLNTGSAY
jgi:hypothetical protein